MCCMLHALWETYSALRLTSAAVHAPGGRGRRQARTPSILVCIASPQPGCAADPCFQSSPAYPARCMPSVPMLKPAAGHEPAGRGRLAGPPGKRCSLRDQGAPRLCRGAARTGALPAPAVAVHSPGEPMTWLSGTVQALSKLRSDGWVLKAQVLGKLFKQPKAAMPLAMHASSCTG